ncbi:MAG: hypothetical protein HY360_18800 [Verrucomicrobia bacterium]|nr:hypothetical protein [Verrucomicrobiota bacterium]
MKPSLFALIFVGLAFTVRAAPSGEVLFHPPPSATPNTPDSALVFGRAAKPPTLDGVIDAAEWATAGRTAFDFNGDAAKRTEVLALYDDANLYLAFRCAEPQAGKIVARFGPGKTGIFAVDAKGDCQSYSDDAIEIWISPDDQQKRVFQFIANTIQGQLDAQYEGIKMDENYTSEVEKVELESRGPFEAVIRAEGWHKATGKGQQPNRVMKYVVRIVAYAGQPMVRVFHSFITTENLNTQYRQITLGFSLKDEETAIADEQVQEPISLPPGAEAALLQVDHDAYRLQMRAPEMAAGVAKCLRNGDRSAGWLLMKRKDWGVTLATRDFWQNYCKGCEVRRDSITFCPWPKDVGRPLSFRPEDVVAPIFVKKLAYSSNGQRAEEGNYTDFTYGYGGIDAIGVSKTHEYLLDFTPTPNSERSRLVQALLNDPPLAIVPPAHACATEVFGRIHPFDAEQFPVEEAGFKAMLARTEYGKPEDNHYGLINFGESYQQSNEAGLMYVYRTYQNSGYGIVNDFYKGYLRSGDRDWFRYAVRRARHNRDLDQVHYGPMLGGQSTFDTLQWRGPAVLSFWPHYFYLLEDWYLTGDRRSWDCYLETCQEAAKLNYIITPRDGRESFNPPKELAHMYEATWNPKFLELARTLVDGILLAKEQAGPGKWPPASEDKDEYLQPALLEYHRVTQDPRVLKYLQDYLSEHKGRQRYGTCKGEDTAARLYWQTGDVKWLDLVGGAENMRNYMRLVDTKRPPPAGGMIYRTVNDILDALKTVPVKYKTPFVQTLLDDTYHHTWERLWLFMAAVDDARKKGILKPATDLDPNWVGPIWNEEYWKTVSPEKAKEYGW